MKNQEIQLHCNDKERSIPQTNARQPSFEKATPQKIAIKDDKTHSSEIDDIGYFDLD